MTAIAGGPALFRALGGDVLRGRDFDDRAGPGAARVVVLSEFTARQIFGTADASGGKSRSRSRSAGSPAAREAVRRADPDGAVDPIGTGRSVLAGPFHMLRGFGLTAIALGAITLPLAMAGLYGIQSHVIANRTREIGVRISFGATSAQIKRMVLMDGYRPVLDGLVCGLLIGLIGRAYARAYLELDVAIVDPWILVVTPIPLIEDSNRDVASHAAGQEQYEKDSRQSEKEPHVEGNGTQRRDSRNRMATRSAATRSTCFTSPNCVSGKLLNP